MSPYFKSHNYSLEKLINCFDIPNQDYTSEDYDDITYEIRCKGEAGNAFLMNRLRTLDTSDSQRLRSLLLALAWNWKASDVKPIPNDDVEWLREQLLLYLDDVRPMIAITAIDGLREQKVGEAQERILPFLSHPNEYMRCRAVSYVAEVHPDIAYPILMDTLRDPSAIVRDSAIDGLVFLEKLEAIPHIRLLLLDPDKLVRESAEGALGVLEAISDLLGD
jgi:hypothetical protein